MLVEEIANENLIVPPIDVYAVAGCGADLLINIMLTILGYVALFSSHWALDLYTALCHG